eukprot:symbB.v1.2.011889.t1/scaffold806.1/size231046/16
MISAQCSLPDLDREDMPERRSEDLPERMSESMSEDMPEKNVGDESRGSYEAELGEPGSRGCNIMQSSYSSFRHAFHVAVAGHPWSAKPLVALRSNPGLAQCSSSWSLEGIHGQVVCPHCIGLAPLMDTPQPNRFRKSCAPPPAEASKVKDEATIRMRLMKVKDPHAESAKTTSPASEGAAKRGMVCRWHPHIHLAVQPKNFLRKVSRKVLHLPMQAMDLHTKLPAQADSKVQPSNQIRRCTWPITLLLVVLFAHFIAKRPEFFGVKTKWIAAEEPLPVLFQLFSEAETNAPRSVAYESLYNSLAARQDRPCIWPDVTNRHALSDLFGAQHLLGSCEVEEPDIPSGLLDSGIS